MKQRNANQGSRYFPSFSALALSLVMGAVIVGESQAQEINEQYSEQDMMAVDTAVPSTLLTTQNVEVAPAMNNPAPAPLNVSNASLNDRERDSISSSNNANGSGIQIFNMNANKNDQDAQNLADVNTGTRADMLRRERIRQELLNESRLIEKIEEDRITTEGSRSTSIEGMAFTNSQAELNSPSDLEEVQVIALSPQVITQSEPVAAVSTTSTASSSSFYSSTQFQISPMAGYRWTPNNNSLFRSDNQIMAGVAVEGRLANILGLEVNYAYGHDKLRDRGFGIDGPSFPGFLYRVRSRNTHEVSANLKLGWFVGIVKPYVMGGFGSRYTAYNIDDSITKAQAASIGWKRSSVNMIANSGAGLDVALSRTFSIGSRVEWQYTFGKKNSYNPYDIVNVYGDTKNKVKAMGSLQVIF